MNFSWPPESKPLRILEATGGGCAFLDYNNDGWLDILLVTHPTVRLWGNSGKGQFVDITAESGLAGIEGYWRGCAVGDYDADGWPDLLLTGYKRLALLRNLPTESANRHPSSVTRRFKNVTRAAGLSPDNRGHWALSAGFMPLGDSGRLDLVIVNYVRFGPDTPHFCTTEHGIRAGCAVNHYRPEFPELWRNDGGRFRDVTAGSGFESAHGRGMTLAFADVNEDGRIDLYVGNDGLPAELFINRGGMKFRNAGTSSGAAYGPMDHPIAAMGADWADYDGDGRLDLTVTAFADEPFALLRNAGGETFENKSDETEIAGATYSALGFGANWLDFDNDGWPDIAYANGHVIDVIEQINPLMTYRQPTMLFHNQPSAEGRKFADLAPQMGPDVSRPIVGRGSAAGDFDNDGRMDLLVVDYEGKPLLLQNNSTTANHWLKLDLRAKGANPFAYGARVTAASGDRRWTAQVSPACSFLSSSDPRIHLGLGSLNRLDRLTIRWPSGKSRTLSDVAANQILRVEE